MKPLDTKHIEKTLLGVVTDWTELFTEHRYAKTPRFSEADWKESTHG